MLGLDFTQFAELFNRWAAQYVAIEPGEWVAVDGKSIRGSVTGYNKAEQNFIMLVSVFSQKRGVVIHAQPMENKYNSEEQVVQAMLAALELNGAVVTLDALHTKKTIDAIKDQNAHYLMCVEGNQKNLHKALIEVTRKHKPIDFYQQHERGHSRWEHRRILLFDQLEGCSSEWTDLTRLIWVQRWGTRNRKFYYYTHYYISDLAHTAYTFAALVRGH